MSDHPDKIPNQLEQAYSEFRAREAARVAAVQIYPGLRVELSLREYTAGNHSMIMGYVDGARIWRDPRTGRTFCGKCFANDCRHVETWLVNFEF